MQLSTKKLSTWPVLADFSSPFYPFPGPFLDWKTGQIWLRQALWFNPFYQKNLPKSYSQLFVHNPSYVAQKKALLWKELVMRVNNCGKPVDSGWDSRWINIAVTKLLRLHSSPLYSLTDLRTRNNRTLDIYFSRLRPTPQVIDSSSMLKRAVWIYLT